MSDSDQNLTNRGLSPQGQSNAASSPDLDEFSKSSTSTPISTSTDDKGQPRQTKPQSGHQDRSGGTSRSDKPKPTPQEARNTYYKWLERLEANAQQDGETKKRLDSTRELVTRLEEPNILAVYRLVEIFGLPVVEEKVATALALHKEAKEKGEAAYKPRENPKATHPEQRFIGTEVATAKGQPRTLGGIFFFIMRGYITRIRLAWEDLHVPWLPDLNETVQASVTTTVAIGQTVGERPNVIFTEDTNHRQVGGQALAGKGKPESGTARVSGPIIETPASNVTLTASSNKSANQGNTAPNEQNREVKPSRGKVVITGSPKSGSQPKVAPQGLAGVLELLFEIAPGGSPPKGLPVLEKTLVKVWITDKQYSKIKDTLTSASRYLIEGEIGVGINSQNFQPFIRVICTRLTTLELELGAKQKRAE